MIFFSIVLFVGANGHTRRPMTQPNSEAIKTIGYYCYTGWSLQKTEWTPKGLKWVFISPNDQTETVIFLRDKNTAEWEDAHEQP